MAHPLKVIVLKPSKHMADGYVERFRWGFMPNSTVPYMRSMTPPVVGDKKRLTLICQKHFGRIRLDCENAWKT